MFRRLTVSALLALALAAPGHAAQGCGISVGLTPLTDLGAGSYLGFQGGLYPGGSNAAPAQHLADALGEAAQVAPRDASGAVEPGCGVIGMISIGMSNTTQEFAVFERQADLDAARHPRVVIATCSQGGVSAEEMDSGTDSYWMLVDSRLAAAGLSAAQVQVAWIKQALGAETNTFPTDALDLQTRLGSIVRILRARFPNLRLCYLSSRIFGGYSGAHPEPVTYEQGFAVKWLIEAQIGGDATLNWNPAAGPVVAPLLVWGPYLWADGSQARSDGLTWCASDFESDGTHPSPSGEAKVAAQLATFFSSDVTAQAWYAASQLDPLVAFDAVADASVDSAAPSANFGADPTLRISNTPTVTRTYLKFDLSALERPIVHAKLSLRNSDIQAAVGLFQARLVSDTSWSESAITFATAPGSVGASVTLPNLSRDGARSLDVTDWVNQDSDGVLSIVLVAGNPSAGPALVHSKEAGWAPRIVVSTRPGAWIEYCPSGATSNGCVPALRASGAPSLSAASGWVLNATALEGARSGLVFYGVNGRTLQPWGSSALCVRAPVQRTGAAPTGGTVGACNGSLTLDWLSYLSNHPGALGAPFQIGATINAQAWFRDPPSAKSTHLSGALEFVTCP